MKPLHTNGGYDVYATRSEAPPNPSGKIESEGESRDLWISEYQTTFAISGSTAQSARTRSYFARSLTQPSITVACQFPNQELMGKFVEFVRTTHLNMESSSILSIYAQQPDLPQGASYRGNRKTKYGYQDNSHRSIQAKGYIKEIKRSYQKGVNAPELTFDFVVKRIITPTDWADLPVTIRRLKSWHSIIETTQKASGFVEDPDQFL
jgi:hypothetical protein